MEIDFNKKAQEIFLANKEKGFWDNQSRDIKNKDEVALKLMLIVSELGEAMEAHRKNKFANIEAYKKGVWDTFKQGFELNVKDTLEDEIADTIIRLFDMAGGLNIDLNFHIENKLKYNATREKLHGKKY